MNNTKEAVKIQIPLGMYEHAKYEARIRKFPTSQILETWIRNGLAIYMMFHRTQEKAQWPEASVYFSIIRHGFTDIVDNHENAVKFSNIEVLPELNPALDNRRKELIKLAKKVLITITIDKDLKQFIKQASELHGHSLNYSITRYIQASLFAGIYARRDFSDQIKKADLQIMEKTMTEAPMLGMYFGMIDGQFVPYVAAATSATDDNQVPKTPLGTKTANREIPIQVMINE